MLSDETVNTLRGWAARLPIERFRAPPPVVSLIRLSGIIGSGVPGRAGLSLAGLDRVIERAFGQYMLKAVALAINSPGGSAAQSAMIARRIRQRAAEKNVPVFAFIEDLAASGGYWLATAADEIYAEETSIVGSIGVITAGFGFSDMLARIGVERRVHTSGRRKGFLDPFREESPEDLARLTSIQCDFHDSFKDQVRARRAGRLKAPEDELFEGDIWTGRQALSLGLIDGHGDVQTVMRERYGPRVTIRAMSQRPPFAWRILPRGQSRHAMTADTVSAAIAAVEEWALWKRYGL